jgi:hypothetical protein
MFLQLKPISVAGSIPGSSSYDCATTADRYAAAGAQIEIIEDAGHSPTSNGLRRLGGCYANSLQRMRTERRGADWRTYSAHSADNGVRWPR